MATWLKQGDQYFIPIACTLNKKPLDMEAVEMVEVCMGNLRKVYPGEVLYDAENRCFLFPVTQEETFGMEANSAADADMRVKFIGGSVIGSRLMRYAPVYDAKSEVVL